MAADVYAFAGTIYTVSIVFLTYGSESRCLTLYIGLHIEAPDLRRTMYSGVAHRHGRSCGDRPTTVRNYRWIMAGHPEVLALSIS